MNEIGHVWVEEGMNYVQADKDPTIERRGATATICKGNLVFYGIVTPEHVASIGGTAINNVFAKMFKWFERIAEQTPKDRLDTLSFNFCMTVSGPEDEPKPVEAVDPAKADDPVQG